jgi:thiosulfate dehydrogenase
VFSTYPKFRARSGSEENIYKRVNDCIERSLNGSRTLDTNSREMQAIYAYMKWLGTNVPKGISPKGSGLAELAYLERPADPVNGEAIYIRSCQRCHGMNGEGLPVTDGSGYIYPPLWGDHSYTTAAGLFRLSRFAGFVRWNMPFDAPENTSYLTDEESWDVAAFVNSRPRPHKVIASDWPDIKGKPFDHPFGPYADPFTEEQHKFGPFVPIIEAKKKKK